jgi:hypothetical protein
LAFILTSPVAGPFATAELRAALPPIGGFPSRTGNGEDTDALALGAAPHGTRSRLDVINRQRDARHGSLSPKVRAGIIKPVCRCVTIILTEYRHRLDRRPSDDLHITPCALVLVWRGMR